MMRRSPPIWRPWDECPWRGTLFSLALGMALWFVVAAFLGVV